MKRFLLISNKEDQASYMNIDWRKLNNAYDCNYDAIDISRAMIEGRDSVDISIKFFKEYKSLTPSIFEIDFDIPSNIPYVNVYLINLI